MKFSTWSFRLAGIVGIIIIFPMMLNEERAFTDTPGPLSHPEYYYGFLAVTLAWQVLFLIVAHDPVRYRIVMIPAMIEKFGYVLFIFWLTMGDRVGQMMIGAAGLDLLWGVLFAVSFVLTGRLARTAGQGDDTSHG